MSDISDDEVIEKPKRVMSEKQKEALAKGRALAKANREAQKKPAETKVEESKEIPPAPKLKRATKKVKEEVREPSPEPVIEIPKGKRVSRKPKVEEVKVEEPERSLSPEPVKKTRTIRKKKTEAPVVPTLVTQTQSRPTKPSLKFV